MEQRLALATSRGPSAKIQIFDHMKRLHLFEVEDLAACPDWIRDCVTAMIVVVHRWFGVPQVIADQLDPILAEFDHETPVSIVDTCSGNGGPMPDALELLAAPQKPSPQYDCC